MTLLKKQFNDQFSAYSRIYGYDSSQSSIHTRIHDVTGSATADVADNTSVHTVAHYVALRHDSSVGFVDVVIVTSKC